ncbi:PepSY-associated TM helix domain-containing protein [Blastopirellula marina]|uniref:PepSY domain-containing protein n=1 Tax=Blastopirellula marina TaxID=124 RepID=A0A2S8FA51_9BACT|nr:PepSY domain-containing protein [Blastopirellula marina]PQO29012.1 PepSY domain-containing protein [Blastopirellula marina]PTL42284.1 PepSY domain-containing protein [Blastopirellula marina]
MNEPSTSVEVLAKASVTRDRPSRAGAASPLYQVVWRWHFYAGILSAPIFWIVTLTGALYVFQTELSAWRDQSLREVAVGEERLSYDRLRELAAAEVGADELEGIVVFPDPGRSVMFIAHAEEHHAGEAGDHDHDHGQEKHRHVYVDPYTGKMLGSKIAEDDFFAIVLDLHRSLMMGTTGRILSELATCWGLLLLATGVYLWWPRGKKNVGVWVPRIKGKLYPVLRDWHAVSGFYFVPLAVIVMGTGLFFSVVMGSAFNASVKAAGHWAPKWFAPAVSAPVAAQTRPASLDQIVATFLSHSRGTDDMIPIRFIANPKHAYKAFLMRDDDKNQLRMVSVDQYTAETIDVVDAADNPFLYRVRVWAVSTHMGKIFGMPTKILALVTSIALFLLSVTGVWMWWKRRPRGRTGFPRRPASGAMPMWAWLVIVIAAVVLPVAGVSMLAVVLIDTIWSRIDRARAES